MTDSEVVMRVYTVVEVMSGVAVGAKRFPSLKRAQTYLKKLRQGRNLEEDDVQLFEDKLVLPTRRRNPSGT